MNRETFLAFAAFVIAVNLVIIIALLYSEWKNRKWKNKRFLSTNGLKQLHMTSKDVTSLLDIAVQPRSGPIPALPIMAVIKTDTPVDKRLVPNPPMPEDCYPDWMETDFVSIRDDYGRLIGSSADVLAVINEYRAKGESIDFTTATKIATERLSAK